MSERTPHPIRVPRPAWIDEFRAFIMRGNVVDLAVGIIIGVAFTAMVNSLVKDIFTPLVGLLVGGVDFTNIFVTLKGPSAATLAEAQKAGAVTLNIGVFLNTVIQFLIVSFAVFWLIKALTHLPVRRDPQPAAPPPPRRRKRGPSTISEKISNAICAPTIAVIPDGSYCGAISTTSPPMISSPLRPCRMRCASRGVSPPVSGVPVPGAKAGSSPSTSKDI